MLFNFDQVKKMQQIDYKYLCISNTSFESTILRHLSKTKDIATTQLDFVRNYSIFEHLCACFMITPLDGGTLRNNFLSSKHILISGLDLST